MTRITETTSGIFEKSIQDPEHDTIQNVLLLLYEGRHKVTEAAMRQSLDKITKSSRIFCKPTPDRNKAGKVAHLIGRVVNLHLNKTGLWGDLQYLPGHGYIKDIAEEMPEFVTVFIDMSASIRPTIEGRAEIEAVHEVHELSIGSESGSPHGLFEALILNDRIDLERLKEHRESLAGDTMPDRIDKLIEALLKRLEDGTGRYSLQGIEEDCRRLREAAGNAVRFTKPAHKPVVIHTFNVVRDDSVSRLRELTESGERKKAEKERLKEQEEKACERLREAASRGIQSAGVAVFEHR